MSVENCLIKECRASNECSEYACKTCGWNPEVAAQRNRQMQMTGLKLGRDGMRRLVLRPMKRGGSSGGCVAGNR